MVIDIISDASELHQHEVWIISSLDDGATFHEKRDKSTQPNLVHYTPSTRNHDAANQVVRYISATCPPSESFDVVADGLKYIWLCFYVNVGLQYSIHAAVLSSQTVLDR